jgi:hypothetical protein
MTAILSDESVEWLSPEDVARLTGRADVGDSITLGFLRSVQVGPWAFRVRREWVDEWVKGCAG